MTVNHYLTRPRCWIDISSQKVGFYYVSKELTSVTYVHSKSNIVVGTCSFTLTDSRSARNLNNFSLTRNCSGIDESGSVSDSVIMCIRKKCTYIATYDVKLLNCEHGILTLFSRQCKRSRNVQLKIANYGNAQWYHTCGLTFEQTHLFCKI